MPLTLHVEPGGEKWVSFAKKKLAQLKDWLVHAKLRTQTQRFKIEDSTIYIQTLQAQYGIWMDFIRITGSTSPLFIFPPHGSHGYTTRNFFGRIIGDIPVADLPQASLPDAIIATQTKIGLVYTSAVTKGVWIYNETFNRTVDPETEAVTYPHEAVILLAADEQLLAPARLTYRAGQDFFTSFTVDNIFTEPIFRTYSEAGVLIAEITPGGVPSFSVDAVFPVRSCILTPVLATGLGSVLWDREWNVISSPAPGALATVPPSSTDAGTSNTFIGSVVTWPFGPSAFQLIDENGDIVTASDYTVANLSPIVATREIVFNHTSSGGTLPNGIRNIVTGALKGGSHPVGPIGPNCLFPVET